MPRTERRGEEYAPDDLFQALRYAAGELAGPDSAAFERRLAGEQAAREALCRAVELAHGLTGEPPLAPRPEYRQRARRRLQPRPRRWTGLFRRRSYPGHPLLWAGLGGVAVALLVWACASPLAPAPPATVVEIQPPAAPVPSEAPPAEGLSDVARVWADLHNPDHLTRVVDDENRRRLRAETHLAHRGDDPFGRLRAPPSLKP
jgi:hypothetical protein